jgi:hypothetical protein
MTTIKASLHRGPESTRGDPEEFVDQCQPWLRTPTFQNRELLPEHEILQEKISTVTKDGTSAPKQRKSRLNMARSYTRITAGHRSKLLIMRSVRVLARDWAEKVGLGFDLAEVFDGERDLLALPALQTQSDTVAA